MPLKAFLLLIVLCTSGVVLFTHWQNPSVQTINETLPSPAEIENLKRLIERQSNDIKELRDSVVSKNEQRGQQEEKPTTVTQNNDESIDTTTTNSYNVNSGVVLLTGASTRPPKAASTEEPTKAPTEAPIVEDKSKDLERRERKQSEIRALWKSMMSEEKKPVKMKDNGDDKKPEPRPSSPSTQAPKIFKHSDTLLLISTCNHIDYTVKFLQSLKLVRDQFDLLVVDDHSVDGTPEILRRMGVRVITKDIAMGLTQSWNLAYGIFKKGNYTNMIIANNDLLIGDGGIDLLRKALQIHPFVVPMSTTLGVGHNPPQSIEAVHDLTAQEIDYVNRFWNYQRIQTGLRERATKLKKSFRERKRKKTHFSMRQYIHNTDGLSFTPTPTKFNGFLFAFRAPDIYAAEFAPDVLFDTDSIMVGQEDALIRRLAQQGITPVICHDVFVFHFKSVTVKASGYVMGSLTETREDLSQYHPELKGGSHAGHFKEQFAAGVLNSDVLNQGTVTLGSAASVVVALATSDPIRNPGAGDIMTAHEFGEAISRVLGWTVRYLGPPDWYDLYGVDVLVTLLPQYDTAKITHDKPTLVKIAWPRNWFERWVKMPINHGLGMYDLILSSSEKGKDFLEVKQPFDSQCTFRCLPILDTKKLAGLQEGNEKGDSRHEVLLPDERSVAIEVLRIATNAAKFETATIRDDLDSDYVFTGSYWNHFREIMRFDPSHVPGFNGAVYGYNWNKAPVSSSFKEICRGKIEYSLMPQVYKSTKIVLDDANHVTAPWGSVNSRVYDALAAGTLVVSNGVIGAQETFGDVLPVFYNATDLERTLKKYLLDPELRRETTNKLTRKVLSDHTYEVRARQLYAAMEKHSLLPIHGHVDFTRSQDEREAKVHSASCRICSIMRTFPGQAAGLSIPILSLTQQKYEEDDISMRIFVANTDPVNYKDIKFMTDIATVANALAGYEAVIVMDDIGSPPWDNAYGYDVTDTILEYLLEASDCTHFIFTNGDNFYNSNLLSKISEKIKAGKQLIAWDFTTHHLREGTNVISVKFVRAFVDLGAVLVDRWLIERTGARFAPQGIFTKDFFARDWWFFKDMYELIGDEGCGIVHEVLFAHQ